MRQRVFGLKSSMVFASVVLLLAGCGGVTKGEAVSPLYDPFRVSGLPAEDGPSGIRSSSPEPEGEVEYTDDGDVDRLALLAVNDVERFWELHYGDLGGGFQPIEELKSWDSDDPDSPEICGLDTYGQPNALYCIPEEFMAWDRGVLVPIGMEFFGDVSVAALLGHEYGHAIQHMADIVDQRTPTVVSEQQADCFAGNYIRWVAEGNSPRFELSTGDGLNHVLAAIITMRDPLFGPDDEAMMLEEGHGTALDRVSAFQIGFGGTPAECAAIDMDDIEERRGDLPMALPYDSSTGDLDSGNLDIDEDSLQLLMDVLGDIYQPAEEPTLSFDAQECDDAATSEPASYCPSTNTISVDLSALQDMGKPADEDNKVLLQGDNTALSVLTSRYALAMQHEKGEPLDTPASALRTACLTGYAQAAMSDDSRDLVLTAGDLDEAVAGLLTNGLVASNVNGDTVPSGFTRIVAYRSGLGGDPDLCYARFK